VRYATTMMTKLCVRVSRMTLEDEKKLAPRLDGAQCLTRSVPVPVSDQEYRTMIRYAIRYDMYPSLPTPLLLPYPPLPCASRGRYIFRVNNRVGHFSHRTT